MHIKWLHKSKGKSFNDNHHLRNLPNANHPGPINDNINNVTKAYNPSERLFLTNIQINMIEFNYIRANTSAEWNLL